MPEFLVVDFIINEFYALCRTSEFENFCNTVLFVKDIKHHDLIIAENADDV